MDKTMAYTFPIAAKATLLNHLVGNNVFPCMCKYTPLVQAKCQIIPLSIAILQALH